MSNPRIEKLGRQVGGQNAAALAEYVDGSIVDAINKLREELSGIVERQKVNIEEAKGTGDAGVQQGANETTQVVKAADKAVKEVQVDPTPKKAEEAAAKVKEAEKSVTQTESELATWRAGVDEWGAKAHSMLGDHDRRIKALEEGQTGLVAQVEGLWVSVRSHAKAIATGGGATSALRRAGRLTIATFVGILAVWLLVVLFTPISFFGSWNYGLGLAAIAAGLVFAFKAATAKDDEIPVVAQAQADAGVDIVRPVQHH